jgi:hypothetical protein
MPGRWAASIKFAMAEQRKQNKCRKIDGNEREPIWALAAEQCD